MGPRDTMGRMVHSPGHKRDKSLRSRCKSLSRQHAFSIRRRTAGEKTATDITLRRLQSRPKAPESPTFATTAETRHRLSRHYLPEPKILIPNSTNRHQRLLRALRKGQQWGRSICKASTQAYEPNQHQSSTQETSSSSWHLQ